MNPYGQDFVFNVLLTLTSRKSAQAHEPLGIIISSQETPLPFDDLRQWIAALDRAGELKRIKTEADPILEIAEITDRVSKASPCGDSRLGRPAERNEARSPGGPALLFQNIKGYPGSQLLINQFGSEARMKLALGVNSFDEFADRMRVFMDLKSPQGFLDKLKMLPLLTEAGKFFPKTVPTGPCKEVIKRDNFSLLDFPILQCWPQDAGRFITLPCVTTRDPKSGKRNLGMYRLQVYDTTHPRRALAAAEGSRGAFSSSIKKCRSRTKEGAPASRLSRRERPHAVISWPAPAAAKSSPQINRQAE